MRPPAVAMNDPGQQTQRCATCSTDCATVQLRHGLVSPNAGSRARYEVPTNGTLATSRAGQEVLNAYYSPLLGDLLTSANRASASSS